MAPPPATAAATPQRVALPNALERADLRSPYAFFRRHVVIFVLNFLWIVGVAWFAAMWIVSLLCIARSALSRGATPAPRALQLYLLTMALYYAAHAVLFRVTPQRAWPTLRAFVRRSLVEFPYFRNILCVFEGREAECVKDPTKAIVPPNDKALFAFHPHGVLSVGCAYNGVHSMRFEASDTRWLVAENLFWFPLLRDILHWLNFDDVHRSTFVRHMTNGRNVGLIPGGFEEATLYERGKHRVFIEKRFGFIKLALQYGYKVHAAYTFGEEETFHALPYFLKQRMQLNVWKVPAVVFFGRLSCFFMPLEDTEITTVVSEAIQLPRIEHPTKDDVAKYHKIYVDTLVALFERNKHKYAKDPNVTLEVY